MSAPPVPVYTEGTGVPVGHATNAHPAVVPGTTTTTTGVPVANAPGQVPAHHIGQHHVGPHQAAAAPGTVQQVPIGSASTVHQAAVAAPGTVHQGPVAAAGTTAATTGASHSLAQRLAASGLPVLQSFEPALGPQPHNTSLYSPQQITLVLTEKVWSIGDKFTVQTADGVHIMQVKGKVVSLHGKKKFTDMHDNELFTLAEKKLKLHKTFHGEAPTGHNFDIEGNFSIGTSKSTVKFVNASDNRPIELLVKGDWLDRSAKITMANNTDRVVAQMSRNFLNARQIVGNKQTYYITVAPNVDLSLIAAICVAIDERENDK